MSKHTPGPWRARDITNADGDTWIDCIAYTSGGRPLGGTLATAHKNGCGKGEMNANARLIAAAPDLLDELETAVAWIADMNDPYAPTKDEILPQLRAAIAKARGE